MCSLRKKKKKYEYSKPPYTQENDPGFGYQSNALEA